MHHQKYLLLFSIIGIGKTEMRSILFLDYETPGNKTTLNTQLDFEGFIMAIILSRKNDNLRVQFGRDSETNDTVNLTQFEMFQHLRDNIENLNSKRKNKAYNEFLDQINLFLNQNSTKLGVTDQQNRTGHDGSRTFIFDIIDFFRALEEGIHLTDAQKNILSNTYRSNIEIFSTGVRENEKLQGVKKESGNLHIFIAHKFSMYEIIHNIMKFLLSHNNKANIVFLNFPFCDYLIDELFLYFNKTPQVKSMPEDKKLEECNEKIVAIFTRWFGTVKTTVLFDFKNQYTLDSWIRIAGNLSFFISKSTEDMNFNRIYSFFRSYLNYTEESTRLLYKEISKLEILAKAVLEDSLKSINNKYIYLEDAQIIIDMNRILIYRM